MNKLGPTDVLSFPMIAEEDTTKNLNFIKLKVTIIILRCLFIENNSKFNFLNFLFHKFLRHHNKNL